MSGGLLGGRGDPADEGGAGRLPGAGARWGEQSASRTDPTPPPSPERSQSRTPDPPPAEDPTTSLGAGPALSAQPAGGVGPWTAAGLPCRGQFRRSTTADEIACPQFRARTSPALEARWQSQRDHRDLVFVSRVGSPRNSPRPERRPGLVAPRQRPSLRAGTLPAAELPPVDRDGPGLGREQPPADLHRRGPAASDRLIRADGDGLAIPIAEAPVSRRGSGARRRPAPATNVGLGTPPPQARSPREGSCARRRPTRAASHGPGSGSSACKMVCQVSETARIIWACQHALSPIAPAS